MNKYQKIMEDIHMDENMKQNILDSLQDKQVYSKNKNKKQKAYPGRRKAWGIALICVCCVVVLAAGVGLSGLSYLSQTSSADSSYSSSASTSYDSAYDTTEESSWEYEDDMDSASSSASDLIESEMQSSNAKRIYTGSVTIECQDFSEAVEMIESLTEENGGFVQDQNIYGDPSQNQSAYYMLRIPSDDFDSFIQSLNQAGTITSQNKSSENITQNYYNVQNYIESLEKERDRLKELMDSAETTADLIAIEDQLTSVERDLQSYQSDLSYMDLDLQYSTVYVYVNQVDVISNTSSSPWDKITSAFSNTWYYFIQVLTSLMAGLIYLLPWILVILVIVAIVLWIRKIRKNKTS